MTADRALFLCTGNYYRSRFAEAVFLHRASEAGLGWDASSRGLWTGENTNHGPIAPVVVSALALRGIPYRDVRRLPLQATLGDLREATRIVGLHEAEHRPIIEARFGSIADRVEYWAVPDVGEMEPGVALDRIGEKVDGLIARLR
ncbi:MAG: low molecular weight phosphatase family protein [Sandaracinaceae bacterium]